MPSETKTTRIENWLSAAVFSGTVVLFAGLIANDKPSMWIGTIALSVGGNGLRWARGM